MQLRLDAVVERCFHGSEERSGESSRHSLPLKRSGRYNFRWKTKTSPFRRNQVAAEVASLSKPVMLNQGRRDGVRLRWPGFDRKL